MPTKTCLSALAAAVLALGVAQPAAAKSPATFNATFTATYQTSWNMPSYVTGGSCFRKNISYGFGEETWTITSRRAGRITASKSGAGRNLQLSFSGDVPARGNHTRKGGNFVRWEPGACGGDAGVQPEDNDCGTRLPDYDLKLRGDGASVYPEPSVAAHMRREKLWFDDCHVRLADGLTEDAWPKVPAKAPVAALFGSQRTVTIKGRQRWNQVFNPGRGGETTTASSLEWKLTLKRVRG